MDQDIRNTIRLLIVDSSVEEAEAILNVFRDAGHSTRAQHITSREILETALSERQKWDLLLIVDLPEDLTVPGISDFISQQEIDIPVMVMSDTLDPEENLKLMKLGVRAVVPQDHNEYFLLTAIHEVEALKIRRHYRRMSVALNESEKQRRSLLDDQVDAVVYVSGGLVRYANPAFLKMVGLQEPEALVGKAFKELVTEQDRGYIDDFLLGVEDSAQAISVIQCPLVVQGGAEIPVKAVISPTSFEGEFTLSLQVQHAEQKTKASAKQSEITEKKPLLRLTACLTSNSSRKA